MAGLFKKQKKRRKLDEFLWEYRKDPEVALMGMTRLSNKTWRLVTGILLTSIFLALLVRFEGWLPAADWRQVVGLGSLIFLLNGVGWIALSRIQQGILERPALFNQFIILLLLTVGISKVLFLMGWSPFLAPLPMLAMILSMIYGPVSALLVVVGMGFYLSLMSPRLWDWDVDIVRLSSVMEGLIAEQTLALEPGEIVNREPVNLLMYVALYRIDVILCLSLTLGGVVSALGVRYVRQQSKPTLVGFLAGLLQALVVIAFHAVDHVVYQGFNYRELQDWKRFLVNPGWALAGAVISGGLVTIFLPAIERVFDIVTERRLLALGDSNNELLRTLRNRAPGTYQHTLGVAQLASNAAEAIGADPLLCQVGAYYHDIGKIVKPEYFVENMGEDKSIHSRLRPSMSKLVIISHVKEGVDLAREEKLPQKIIDMIPMHHGTTVVEYFYHKALELSERENKQSETEYRYPGPRPRFREAGILMLADAVEAIAKTMKEPNPARFKNMVHDMGLKRLLDGQLNECNLTMKDIHRIEDSFTRTLTNMYHGRIQYPSAEGEEDTAERPHEEKEEKDRDSSGPRPEAKLVKSSQAPKTS